MMIFRKPYLFMLAAIVTSSAAFGATANDIVRRAQTANAQVSYRGTKVARILVGGRAVTSAMEVTHMKPDMTRTAYLSPKVLAGVVVVQRGAAIWRFGPRRKTWEQLHGSGSVPAGAAIDVALQNYRVRLIGSQKTIGRDAYVVLAAPKRAGESVLRLWIDKQTYLTLRTQVEKPSGEVASSTSFSTIGVNPSGISRSAFAVLARPKAAAKVVRLDFRVAKPRYLPKGYKYVGVTTGRVNGRPYAHLQFSNGVNTVSLFQRRSEGNARAPKVPDHLVSVMTWTKHEMLFTLIGDLPRAELAKIANSTM